MLSLSIWLFGLEKPLSNQRMCECVCAAMCIMSVERSNASLSHCKRHIAPLDAADCDWKSKKIGFDNFDRTSEIKRHTKQILIQTFTIKQYTI